MPELPEVEVVRGILDESLRNRRIIDVDIRYKNIILDEIDSFKNHLMNKEIMGMDRYGKYLIFKLDKGYILSHLRMEGKYYYTNDLSIDNKHIHVVFHLDNGYYLMYQDTRKFGRMKYLEDNIYTTPPLSLMGPDLILSDINLDSIYKKIKSKRIEIKSILLDQEILSGLGNIYVDEVLFKSKISPLKKGYKITKKEVNEIILNSKEILEKAILCKGTTIKSYTSSLNVKGNYQNFLQVHTKSICPNCKMILNRDKIRGRMTYYCKNCQRWLWNN